MLPSTLLPTHQTSFCLVSHPFANQEPIRDTGSLLSLHPFWVKGLQIAYHRTLQRQVTPACSRAWTAPAPWVVWEMPSTGISHSPLPFGLTLSWTPRHILWFPVFNKRLVNGYLQVQVRTPHTLASSPTEFNQIRPVSHHRLV